MTCFIIRDTLIIICLFYYLHKNLNKMNGQTNGLKVKNDTFNETDGVSANYKKARPFRTKRKALEFWRILIT